MKGEEVKRLQQLLGVCNDGIFGKNTLAALKKYQADSGLKADGIAGVRTFMSLTGDRSFKEPPDFKQYDARWGKKIYSSHGDKTQTIASSGCGPTSMANAVVALTGESVTPADACEKALSWGDRSYSNGTNWSFFGHAAKEYGLALKATNSLWDALECLEKGGVAVVSFGKSKWTSGGHYCLIWGYDKARFFVRDPASAKESRAFGTADEVTAARKRFFCFTKTK